MLIHEIFGLKDEEAAKVLIKLAEAASKSLDEKAAIEHTNAKGNARDFAALMIGFWTGLNTARLYPWSVYREVQFVASIIANLDKGEEFLVERIVRKIEKFRAEQEKGVDPRDAV